ncbi:hypothetical protein CJ255_00120 [Candidatus Viridilinea mediisalina]|uniref:Uncharacterized protein n=2 Tax=Candidatus Viridilinea mediisalina TaxID=2024553 RepID=A0A2A6RQ40_9CHLR|nr:hypothetical protein CJ255_00120 [Candidatus Viridilinea mediisalina]
MTTLTIELAPDVYALLRAEARQRGQAEQELVAQFLAERLTGVQTPRPVVIAPEVQALLRQMTERDMLVPPQGTAADAVRHLEAWNAADGTDEDEEGEGTWEDVLRAIDANRAEYRKLFADRDTQP